MRRISMANYRLFPILKLFGYNAIVFFKFLLLYFLLRLILKIRFSFLPSTYILGDLLPYRQTEKPDFLLILILVENCTEALPYYHIPA